MLCRVNAGLLPVQVLAHDRGIPATAAVGDEFLRRTGVRSALAYLRLACAAADGTQLRGGDLGEVARRPNRRITARAVDALRNRRSWTLSTLRAHADAVGSADTDRLHLFADDLEGLATLVDRDAAAILRSVRDDVGLGAAMGTLDNSGRGRDASHLDDVTALLAIAAVHPDPATFEAWLRDHLQGVTVADDPRAPGQVTLSTVHRVKGLEWERVIVLGAHEGVMPHRLTDDEEEERRVFHVALDPVPGAGGAVRRRLGAGALHRRAHDAARAGRGPNEPSPGSNAPGGRPRAAFTAPESPRSTALKRVAARTLPRRRRARVHRAARHDLDDIAAARPASERELCRISGIGPTKLERYGPDILRIVNDTPAAGT